MDQEKQQRAADYKYSAVIPVFNSEAVVGKTIDRTIEFFETQGWKYEIIAVNDGSRDRSWHILREKAAQHPDVISINLLRNYGQHNAVLCGLQHCTGEYAITLDDDLQNPPEEIIHLVDKALDGHDLVLGRFRQKKHAGYRRLGSRIVEAINVRVFHQPKDLVMTNFRCIHRDVVKRVCAYNTSFPYISGLVLMFSSDPVNVWVEHSAREVGKSNYNLFRIASLVTRILFNYSSFPLQAMSSIGILTAVLAFLLGIFYFFKGLFFGASVPGWTTVVVLLSMFSSFQMIILAMVGEYIVRLVQQFGSSQSYHIKNIINYHE